MNHIIISCGNKFNFHKFENKKKIFEISNLSELKYRETN